jgi:hypothetical protein
MVALLLKFFLETLVKFNVLALVPIQEAEIKFNFFKESIFW